jgi:hypothetical protein
MQIITHNNSNWIIFILTLLFTLNSSNIYLQCPPGNVELYSQADVIAFASNYPNCTAINGYLLITGQDITNLNSLQNLQTLEDLYIEDTGITNMNYFPNLQNISSFYYYSNPLTTEISGFNSLNSGSPYISIAYNSNLISINGFNNVTSIIFNTYQNSSLTSLIGLLSMQTGSLGISDINLNTISLLNNISTISLSLETTKLANLNFLPSTCNLDYLYLVNNSMLSTCNYSFVCDYLESHPYAPNIISGNSGLCSNYNNVWSNCTNLPYNSLLTLPTSGSSNVSYATNISWTNSPFATGYKLSIGTTPSGNEILNNLNMGNSTSYNHPISLPYLTTIYVTVTPYNVHGDAPNVITQSFVTSDICPSGNLNYTNQSQINNFIIHYPDCVNFAHNICVGDCNGGVISNTNINNLNGFSNLQTVTGNFEIDGGTQINNLSPLTNLTYIGGALTIQYTDIQSLVPLHNLESVGSISFSDNNSFTNLYGLNLSSCNSVFISQEYTLTSLAGLETLTSLNGLFLQTIPNLNDINGLNNMQDIGNFDLSGLGSLSNLQPISNVNFSGGWIFRIQGNGVLSTCDVPSVCTAVEIYLAGNNQYTNHFLINGNATGCNSILEVDAECSEVLPIDLIDFGVKEKNNDVHLHWQTSSEINNNYFVIEHSTDGLDFKSIGRKEGAGNNNTLLDYHFEHKDVGTGMHYYRLKQVDYDGQFSYSDIVSVNVEESGNKIEIYPNPASDFIDVSGMTNGRYEIRDISGKMLRLGNLVSSAISLEGLSSGIYFVTLTNELINGIFKVHKL